jgi:hypothetical protein
MYPLRDFNSIICFLKVFVVTHFKSNRILDLIFKIERKWMRFFGKGKNPYIETQFHFTFINNR